MELINATRLVAGCAMGLEPSGRELLVIVIKGTFVLPKAGEEVRLHETQVPLVMADTFTGEPGLTAPVHEVDFAPCKPMCDVLLLGSAYAAGGRAATRVSVGLRVGRLTKTIDVVGDRIWRAGVAGIRASEPRPFTRMPLSYDVAFGGVDREHDDPKQHDAYRPNPVGRGFRSQLKAACVDGRPLPNTEAPGQTVVSPQGRYGPMAFGPIGRGWDPRYRFAGTYDQRWLDDEFPFLPRDFDERYYQAAPADQQVAVPRARLDVALANLTADGQRRFELPYVEVPVHIYPRRGEREDVATVLDTIVLEPDQERLTMTWRVARPLKKNMHEIAQVRVGSKGRDWWQQHEEATFPVPVTMVAAASGSSAD